LTDPHYARRWLEQQMNVSRETFQALEEYVALLRKWTGRINLVSKASLNELWKRHIIDSAQIFMLSDATEGHWVDIGTGGGFPGVVVAILARNDAPRLRFTLVESDVRKSVFLRTVSQNLQLNADVQPKRIEHIAPLNADILSARALAPLSRLLEYAQRHLSAHGTALFPKGASYRHEIREALENWRFRRDEYPSRTEPSAVILKLGDIRRV